MSKYPPNTYKMPMNYRVLRKLEWHRISMQRNTTNDWEVWEWLGQHSTNQWSYRDNITGLRNYYFEDEQDAMFFSLRWI